MIERAKEKEASQLVSDVVAFCMMLPIIGAGIAAAIGLVGGAARYALYGGVPELGAVLSSVSGQTQMIILAAVGFAYWVVFNYLFGENVSETLDQAEEARNMAEDDSAAPASGNT